MVSLIDIFTDNIFIKPRLNLTQWSEQYRILSRESSSNYGRFKAFEYQKEPMNEISNPKVRKVVLLWASQLGKSEMINNAVGYFIHQEPSTILFMLPNENDAEDYSKRRLAPMFRDTKSLSELINAQEANNTILIKNFRGGNLALVGSNSVSKLASKPIKILLVDEADRCENTKEGSAISLAEKRTVTFADRKIIISSTPTIKGTSIIEEEFNQSDQRYFYVNCPYCKFSQTLKFSNVVWDKKPNGTVDYDSVRYSCIECGTLLTEQEKNQMVKNGKYIAKNTDSDTVGFFLNALYSPFYPLKEIVKDFMSSHKDSAKLQAFTNTIEAKTFEPPTTSFNNHELYERKEDYDKNTIPNDVEFITAGADIQKDRIEVNFIGWGVGYEAYNIIREVIDGDTAKSEVWEKAYKVFLQPFIKENGTKLNISIALIDSGFRAEEVYSFCLMNKRFVATKGLSETSLKADFVGDLKKLRKKINFMNIGTYKGKAELFRLLQIKEQGEGYFHYSKDYDLEFFRQLTAEKIQKVQNARGYKKLQWVKTRDRNEALDISVLCLAGAKFLKSKKRRRKKVLVK